MFLLRQVIDLSCGPCLVTRPCILFHLLHGRIQKKFTPLFFVPSIVPLVARGRVGGIQSTSCLKQLALYNDMRQNNVTIWIVFV